VFAIKVIGTIVTHLGDCFIKNIFGIFLEKFSKKIKYFLIVLFYFIFLNFPKKYKFQKNSSPFTSLFVVLN
jgi:hypothetical protein